MREREWGRERKRGGGGEEERMCDYVCGSHGIKGRMTQPVMVT